MKYLRFGIYILLIFIFVFLFWVLPRIVKVNKIECYNQYGICSNEFLNKVGSAVSLSIYDAKKRVSEAFNSVKSIEDYSFRFKLPSTLRIDMVLKKARYALYNKNLKEIAVIDAKGVVLEKVETTNLPYVVTDKNLPVVGETVGSKDVFALELIYGIYYLYQIKEGVIVGDSLEIIMSDGVKIIFPLEKERDILLGSMKIVLSRLNQDENSPRIGKVKEIDLRYKNPVIRYD